MYFCLNGATIGGGGPAEDFVKLSADAGFPGCDVDIGYGVKNGVNALKDLYAKHHQRFGGWGPADWRSDPAKHQDCVESLRKAAPVAAAVGADSCSTWLMPASDLTLMDNWRFHVERLSPLAKVLGEHGLRLGLEFVAPYHHRRSKPHEFVFTPGQMLELAAAIGPNVGLLVDSFHLHTAGEPMSRAGDLPKDKIVLCHINDAPAGPACEQKDFVRLLPGQGVLDLKAYVAGIKKSGYDGPVSIEVFSEELKKLPKADAAKKAWESLKPLA